jgi:ankyrin repeat protein
VEIRDIQNPQSGSTTNSRNSADPQVEFQESALRIEEPTQQPTELTVRETMGATSDNQAAIVGDLYLANSLPVRLPVAADLETTNDLAELVPLNFGSPISDDFDSLLETICFNPDRYTTHTVPENTNSLLLPTTDLMLNNSRAVYRDSLPTISASIGKTMSLLPIRVQQELQNLTPDAVILKQILFLLMNNFAVENHPTFTTLFQQIKHFSTAQLEYVLRAFPESYSLALQQSFLILAIKADAPSIVRLLLDQGLQIDQMDDTHNIGPLTLACKLRRVRIVEMFLQSRVDLSKALATVIGDTSIMMKTPDGELSLRHESHRILELLLKAGAKVDLYDLSHAGFLEDTSILDIYVKFARSPIDLPDTYAFRLEEAIVNIIRVRDADKAASAIQRMLGQQFHTSRIEVQGILKIMQGVLGWASLNGTTNLVDFLLERGLVPDTFCLCQAIRGGNEQLGRRYIQGGVDASQAHYLPRSTSASISSDPPPFAGVLSDNVDPILSEGIDMTYYETSPLAEAVRWGRQVFIDLFEEMGISNTMGNARQLNCVLLAAAEIGNMDLMQRLIESSNPATLSGSCHTLAALGNHRNIILMLMTLRGEPSPSLIATAVAVRDPELVRFLLKIPMHSQALLTALYFAVRWADISIVKDLVRAGAYLDAQRWSCEEWRPRQLKEDEFVSPLKEAIRLGHFEVARFLLDSGADINEQDSHHSDTGEKDSPADLTPLSVAIKQNHKEFVQELLSRGAEPKDARAFEYALLQSKSMFQLMLDAFRQCYPQGDLNFARGTLREAIRDEDETTISLLGPHINVNSSKQKEAPYEYTDYDSTLFSEAVQSRNISIIRTLLACGGDPNLPTFRPRQRNDKGQWTPFSDAIATDDVLVVRLLHEAGANLNATTEFGALRTPLQLAVERGNPEVIDYLLKNGAEVNAAPCARNGATAIQLAAIKGNVGLAERLIEEYGADFNAPACKFQGRTAFEGAAEHGRLDMLLMLYHKGVDLISDGGTQAQRAMKFAEENGQMAAKSLVEQIWQTVSMGVGRYPQLSFVDPFI